MSTIIRIGVLIAMLFAFAGIPEVFAQRDASQSDGWQGPRPTPRQRTITPAPQRPIPEPGKQVLEIPSRPQQRTLEPP
ncbi:MAG: hypothetical protein ACRERD_02490, partial [Candidatus Binatia bacterium]